jgi:hypothetical protein
MDYLETLWKNSNQPKKSSFPKKIFGMSLNLFKSILVAAVGIALQLAFFLIKKTKTRKLEEMKREEDEKRKQMEEEWRLS